MAADDQLISTGFFSVSSEDAGKANIFLLQRHKKMSTRVTAAYLTKYEATRVIGTRALQISNNAPIYIDPKGESNPLKIALMELREKKLPIIVRRMLPDGDVEDWPLEDLHIDQDLFSTN